MEVFEIMSDEKRALLSAVANIQLPIVIEGKVATGKSFVARYLHSQGTRRTYDLLEEEDGYVSLEKLEELVREKEDINNLVIVSYAGTKDVISQLDEHIKIKCFHNPEFNRRDIHIILVKRDNVPEDELQTRLVRPMALLRGFGKKEVIEHYEKESVLRICGEIETNEALVNLVAVVEGRVKELSLSGHNHYQSSGLTARHFILNLNSEKITKGAMYEYLLVYSKYARATGIYLTLYTEDPTYDNEFIMSLI